MANFTALRRFIETWFEAKCEGKGGNSIEIHSLAQIWDKEHDSIELIQALKGYVRGIRRDGLCLSTGELGEANGRTAMH